MSFICWRILTNEVDVMSSGPRRWAELGICRFFHVLFLIMLMLDLVGVVVAKRQPTRNDDNAIGLHTEVTRGTAVMEISYFRHEKPIVEELEGLYSVAGTMKDAQGKPQQIHPLSCGADNITVVERPWIAIIVLEEPRVMFRCSEILLAQKASEHGASAVLFDIKDNKEAAKQLSARVFKPFDIPVILLDGKDATKLGLIVSNNLLNTSSMFIRRRVNGANRKIFADGPTSLIIILALVSFFVVACVFAGVIIKWKCLRSNHQSSMSDVAKGVLSKMKTRKFIILDSDMDACAICLDNYKEGQELRSLPCTHEFHKKCVDPWLIESRTCPLCMYNIIEGHGDNADSVCSSDVHVSPPPALRNTTAPSLARNSNQSHGQYYSPMTNITNIHSYPYHGNMGSPGNETYQQLFVPSSHPAANMYREQYPGVQTRPPPFSPVNYQLLRYNMLPLSTAQMPGILSPGFDIAHCEPFNSDCVHGLKTHKGGSDAKNKGIYSASNGRRKLHGRYKSSIPRSRGNCSTRLHTQGLVDIMNSSSDSEHERKTRTISSRSHIAPYVSSQFDADVSGTSTGGQSGADSDGPCPDSGSSQVNLSMKSVFGSSDVPSDISSCEWNVYGAEGMMQEDERQPGTSNKAVLLKPACMTQASRKFVRTKNKHKALPYSVIKGSGDIQQTLVPRGTPEAEDSDQTVSSVDTTGMSPHVSGWSSNSGSDSNNQPSTSQEPVAFTSVPAPNAICPLCLGHSAGFSNLPIQPPTVNRSNTMLFPPTSFKHEQFQSHTSYIQTLHGRPPELLSGFYQHQIFDFTPSMSAQHVYNTQVTMAATSTPHAVSAPIQNSTSQWEAFPESGPVSAVQENTPKGTLSKAGSTYSFFCYPSNQHSSSASSSPLHTHQPADVATGIGTSQHHDSHHRNSHSSNHRSNNRQSLVVHSNHRGNVTTNSLHSQLYPLGNMV